MLKGQSKVKDIVCNICFERNVGRDSSTADMALMISTGLLFRRAFVNV